MKSVVCCWCFPKILCWRVPCTINLLAYRAPFLFFRVLPVVATQVRAELYKLSSLSLCSNTIGQLATGIMINPPKAGDPSYETFTKVQLVYGMPSFRGVDFTHVLCLSANRFPVV